MSEKKESQRKTQTKMQLEIVNFRDIDTNEITFQKPKSNKYNGSQIGILYNGRTMFVKYEGLTPFGLKENFDKEGNYQGTSMQINCDDKYLQKAKELHRFFINAFMKINEVYIIIHQRVVLKVMMNMVKVVYGKEFVKIFTELIKILRREKTSIIHQRWNSHYSIRMIS